MNPARSCRADWQFLEITCRNYLTLKILSVLPLTTQYHWKEGVSLFQAVLWKSSGRALEEQYLLGLALARAHWPARAQIVLRLSLELTQETKSVSHDFSSQSSAEMAWTCVSLGLAVTWAVTVTAILTKKLSLGREVIAFSLNLEDWFLVFHWALNPPG